MTAQTEKDIFLEALEHPVEAREAFVLEACGEDTTLGHAVGELLRAYDRSETLLEAGAPALSGDDFPIAESAGKTIGPYKLMEQIGEGGFGLVFVAEQYSPVRRRVALKVLKPGMNSRDVIARLEAERQALALMNHPNIAQVLDAGTTDIGLPYFVMELVRGTRITTFCEDGQLSLEERLELFIQVCQGVQHAHQKGVIHRDLKPSNILVTLHDSRPVAKVIDFGVAKAVGQSLTDKTVYTRFSQMIGTPTYMSPEQAEMSGLDVDTRSDIYSLGVLLYELLTGTTPFDSGRLDSAGFDEIRRIIREEEPPRPSTRLSTLVAPVPQRIEPRKLSAFVRGDLDWIVMKALDKDRSRRYETASALADDVRRFLNSEVVQARPPSPAYRLRKFALRNRVIFITTTLVATALMAGIALSTWQAIRATKAQQEAERLRKQTEQFVRDLKSANVLLASARANSDQSRWAAAFSDYADAIRHQPEHSLVWSGRGSLHLKLGLWNEAATDYAKAQELGAVASLPEWNSVPAVLLYEGREAAYRRACEQLYGQFASLTQDYHRTDVARACLISADPVGNPEKWSQWAERRLEPERREPDRSGNGRGPPWRRGPGGLERYVAGLAAYRCGRLDRAAPLLEECLRDSRWSGHHMARPLLAMTLHRQGKTAEAQKMLESAEKALDEWVESALRDSGALPRGLWHSDWLETNLTYREAKRLLTGSTSFDPRLNAIRELTLQRVQLSKE